MRPFEDFEAELIPMRDPGNANRPRLRPEYETLRTAAPQRMRTSTSTSGTPATGPVCLPGRIPYVMWFSFAIEFLPAPAA